MADRESKYSGSSSGNKGAHRHSSHRRSSRSGSSRSGSSRNERSHRSSSRRHSKTSHSGKSTSSSRYVIAVALMLIGGLILYLSLRGKKQNGQSLSFQDMLSFDASEITLGSRLFSFVNDNVYVFVNSSTNLPD